MEMRKVKFSGYVQPGTVLTQRLSQNVTRNVDFFKTLQVIKFSLYLIKMLRYHGYFKQLELQNKHLK